MELLLLIHYTYDWMKKGTA